MNAIHDAIRDNHPGPVDPQNPHFRDWLENGLVLAEKQAVGAQNYTDYTRTLRRYTNGFEDGHIAIDFTVEPRMVDWPGFVAGDLGDGQVSVIYAEPDSGVKVGEQIRSCDGRSIDSLMKERVDPYFWNAAIPHARAGQATSLFNFDPDEETSQFVDCEFTSEKVVLNWRPIDNKVYSDLLDSASGGDAHFGLKLVDGVWFVRLPRFWTASDVEAKTLNDLIAEIAAKAPEMRKGIVVFDVRRNGGGNSLWGNRMAAALWGQDWVDHVEASFDQRQEVRASAANIAKVAKILDQSIKRQMKEAIPYWTEVLTAMRMAYAAGKPLASVGAPPAPPSSPEPLNPISGRVLLLTDAGCGSACLDFADLVLKLPASTQIGYPTFGDAIYIDVNQAPLPSGLGVLDYGMKAFHHRLRANNQWYDPKYRWPGGPMTDETLSRWVKTLGP